MTFRSFRARALPLLATAIVGSLWAPAAGASAPVPGHVNVARVSGDALLIWDASLEIATIVKDKISDADANTRLEHDAQRLLATSLDKLSRDAKTITLRIVYSKTGAVSPVYGSATFAGLEKYAEVSAPVQDVANNRDKFKDVDDSASFPAWLSFKVLGKLPPR